MEKSFYEKKATVVGLARSGVGAANLLAFLGANVTITDIKPESQLVEPIKQLDRRVSVVTGSHPSKLFESAEIVVVSPGVPLDAPPLDIARKSGARVIGEIELAYEALLDRFGKECPEILAITGSNGKSTTTTLLYETLIQGNISAILAGNIGNSMAAEVLRILDESGRVRAPRFIVLELSSFQLETMENFRPKVAAVLNITPDHLDRYHEMEAYIEAKCRISLNQGALDYLVVNADDPLIPEVLNIVRRNKPESEIPRFFYFSRKRKVKGAYLENGLIRFDMDIPIAGNSRFFDKALDPATFRIKGAHNIENAMAASVMALLAGCEMEAIQETLKTFPGLEHRLEFVREIDGVKYINDSKGTNVGATLKSLEGFSEPVILILGGRDKAGDFTLLRPLLKEKVKKAILVGEAAGKIREAISDIVDCESAGRDFSGAIAIAKASASPGDVVLLSPACASFDMFSDFEDRGRQFKQIVMSI